MIAIFVHHVRKCNYTKHEFRPDGFGRNTVLADCALTAAQLIRLAKPLGVSATNVKSHLTRMVADGILEREGPI